MTIQLADRFRFLRQAEVTSEKGVQKTNINLVEEPRLVYSPEVEAALALANGTFGAAFFVVSEVLALDITVEATAESSYTYAWSWGDGSNETVSGVSGAVRTHSYANEGVYTVTLVVRNAAGENVGDFTRSLIVEKTLHVGLTNTYGITYPQRYIETVEDAITYLPGNIVVNREWTIVIHNNVVETTPDLDLSLEFEANIQILGSWQVSTLSLPAFSFFKVSGVNVESKLLYEELNIGGSVTFTSLNFQALDDGRIFEDATSAKFNNCYFTTTATVPTKTQAYSFNGACEFNFCYFDINVLDLAEVITVNNSRVNFNQCHFYLTAGVNINIKNLAVCEFNGCALQMDVSSSNAIGIQVITGGELYFYNSVLQDKVFTTITATGRVGIKLGDGTNPANKPKAKIFNSTISLSATDLNTFALEVWEDGRLNARLLRSFFITSGTGPSVRAVGGIPWTGNKFSGEGMFGCVVSNGLVNINMTSPTILAGDNLSVPD